MQMSSPRMSQLKESFHRHIRLLLLVAAVVLAAGATLYYAIGYRPIRRSGHLSVDRPANPARIAPAARVVLKIDGMDCIMCAGQLQNTLRQVPGVHDAEVSFQDKEARISFDPSSVAPARLEEAIAKAGFKIAQAGR